MSVDVDATLQVEVSPGVLAPLQVADDVGSPTTKALPVLDADARVTLLAILAALGATVTVDGTVALSPATLAALETITVVATDLDIRNLTFASDRADVSGSTVILDAATIAALETINVGNLPADFPDVATLAKLELIRLLLAGTLDVDGTVELGAATLAALETVNAAVFGTVSVDNFPASPDPITGYATAAHHGSAQATLTDIDRRYVGGKSAVVATVTAGGDTTIHTPAAGNAVRLFWISAINDPDQATSPLIKIRIGADEIYRAYAVAHWEVFEGGADEPLVINLDGSGSVAVTAHIQEVTP